MSDDKITKAAVEYANNRSHAGNSLGRDGHREARLGFEAGAEWQAAQRQGGEAVAWRVSHPDKKWDVYQQYPAWAEGDFVIQPLYTAPQPRPAVPEDFREAAQRQGGEAVSWEPSGKEYDHAIHTNPDAKAWADLFIKTFPNCGADPDLMCGWFANAMMAMHDHIKNNEEDAQGCEPLGFHGALKLANSVVNAYCQDNPKWHKKIAGTPILNDLAVRMAKVFAGFYHLPEPPEDT